MVDDAVVKTIQVYLKAVQRQGIPVKCGVVFGSYATGNSHQWSDIDLLVVSSQFDTERKRQDIDKLWHIAGDTDSRIEPFAVGERQYEEDDSSAIIEIARREGQIIPLVE